MMTLPTELNRIGGLATGGHDQAKELSSCLLHPDHASYQRYHGRIDHSPPCNIIQLRRELHFFLSQQSFGHWDWPNVALGVESLKTLLELCNPTLRKLACAYFLLIAVKF